MADFTVIIPARLASSRLPNKLLKMIGDKTVLEHSYLAAQKSNAKRVIIAADHQSLVDAAEQFGAEVILTSKTHTSGTDRLAECVQRLGVDDDAMIVNLQADEPFMPADLIDLCAETLNNDKTANVSTLATRLHTDNDIDNPNVVKVIINQQGHALYFSRAPIPFNRDNLKLDVSQHYFHHLGIYGYRAGFLSHYSDLPNSELEEIEKLEQLRILDHGDKISVAITDIKPPKGIDTQADLDQAIAHHQRET